MAKWTAEEERQIEMQAEVMRRALNPSLQDRTALLERPAPLPGQIVRCESPTGAQFTARIIQRDSLGKGLRQTLTVLTYKYPPSQVLRDAGYDCVDGPDAFFFAEGSRPQHEDTGKLTAEAKQELYRQTYGHDLLEFNDRTLAHCKARGLKVLDTHVDEGHPASEIESAIVDAPVIKDESKPKRKEQPV